jgi:23S rRNA pseudouridine2605 synthase
MQDTPSRPELRRACAAMPRKPAPRRPGKPPWKPPAKSRSGGRPGAAPGEPGPLRAVRRSDDKRPPRSAATADTPDSAGDAADSPRGERLQKILASAGIASRRECELLITEGRVEVDGQVVSELGARVDRQQQEIKVDGEPLPRPKLVYYAVNKPTGVVTTARDPAGRPRVIDLLPPSAGRVFTVGRLDLESEGLILLTNDGELANQLAHPKHGVEKTYIVQVAGHPDPDVLVQLRRGVHLSEGYSHAVHARIKSTLKKSTLLEMVLDEGRNREIRRLLARVGHKVQRLTRVAVGPVRLGEMPRGAHRKLTQDEVRKLHEAVAAGPRSDRDDARPPRRPQGPPRKKPGGVRAHGGKADGRPPAGKARVAKPPYGKPVGGRSSQSGQDFARKPRVRKPIVGGPPAEGVPEFRRKIVGDGDAAGASEERPRAGRPHGGKPKFRKPVGTKVVGRKPIKRRRRERPQR